MALIEPDGIDHAFHCAVEISIVKYYEGRLATEFQRELLSSTRCGNANGAAHFGGTRKRNLIDAFVRNQ